MDKTHERETRDFMNVDSFSQLPFIRPAPPVALKEKGGSSAIRLFGKEFGTTNRPDEDGSDSSTENEKNNLLAAGGDTNKDDPTSKNNTDSTTSSNRKFECHYCCRNFPTSQALGGHQNAHKRERQHAKRAHLQSSSMVRAAGGHHVYGLMNYNNRFGSGPTIPMGYGDSTWNATNNSVYNSNSRLYSSHGAYNTHHEPINGSPLALWRIPSNTHNSSAFTRERPLPVMQQQIPLLLNSKSKDGQLKPLSTITGSSESRFRYGSKQDNVSLDLHL